MAAICLVLSHIQNASELSYATRHQDFVVDSSTLDDIIMGFIR